MISSFSRNVTDQIENETPPLLCKHPQRRRATRIRCPSSERRRSTIDPKTSFPWRSPNRMFSRFPKCPQGKPIQTSHQVKLIIRSKEPTMP